MNNTKRHGYYSVKAAEVCYTCIYETETGEEIEITAVYNSKEEADDNYLWDDKVYVGVVAKFLRKGTKRPFYREPEPYPYPVVQHYIHPSPYSKYFGIFIQNLKV